MLFKLLTNIKNKKENMKLQYSVNIKIEYFLK